MCQLRDIICGGALFYMCRNCGSSIPWCWCRLMTVSGACVGTLMQCVLVPRQLMRLIQMLCQHQNHGVNASDLVLRGLMTR